MAADAKRFAMNHESGYIGSNPRDARRLFEALKKGAVGFSWVGSVTRYDCFMIPADSIATNFEPPDKINRYLRCGSVIFGIIKAGCFHFNLLVDHEQFGEEYINEKLFENRSPKDAGEVAHLLNLISDLAHEERRNILVQ